MSDEFIKSSSTKPLTWAEAESLKPLLGPKGAFLATLPRVWTPPFILLPVNFVKNPNFADLIFAPPLADEIISLGNSTNAIIVRSSVIGESIWDRGTYESVVVELGVGFEGKLQAAANIVVSSAGEKPTALVVQSYIAPKAQGEFGNLFRVSKTRDHWELSDSNYGAIGRTRFNAQRDKPANSEKPLLLRAGLAQERQFAAIAAWINSHLIGGKGPRVNCEWISDGKRIWLVQIDEEDEDRSGTNPFHITVSETRRPVSIAGELLKPASEESCQIWDKLKVLEELWDSSELERLPILFYVELASIKSVDESTIKQKLQTDFERLIGLDGIIVRTSGRAGAEKILNLPRTECKKPDEAAAWCLDTVKGLIADGQELNDLAFVAHRFIDSRASAWARAEPGNPLVVINSLWGLPDALQYCPYDIWEVHLPTDIATEYSEYKPNILLNTAGGGWRYVRVRNDLARSLSVGRREALDIARRSKVIADRLGKPCHIMWFVGCVEQGGNSYNLPWYWTEAHSAEKNVDRSRYSVFAVRDYASLKQAALQRENNQRLALELRPEDLDLMRDSKFVQAVGEMAKSLGVPVMLAGSTLAHAYYQLRRSGCVVLTLSEKDHSRVRRPASFGKLVRDKIPDRIAQRLEAEVTHRVPKEIKKGYLLAKLLEEALEVRAAPPGDLRKQELADLLEVLRALIDVEGESFGEIERLADEKKKKAGGFDEGLILAQTGILGSDRYAMAESAGTPTERLANQVSEDTYELPFSFFGFMETDAPRSLNFPGFGVRVTLELKADRLVLRVYRNAEQFELPLDADEN